MSLSPKPTAGQTCHGPLPCAQLSSVAQDLGSPPGQGQLWPQVTMALGQDTAHAREHVVGNQTGMRYGCALA